MGLLQSVRLLIFSQANQQFSCFTFPHCKFVFLHPFFAKSSKNVIRFTQGNLLLAYRPRDCAISAQLVQLPHCEESRWATVAVAVTVFLDFFRL